MPDEPPVVKKPEAALQADYNRLVRHINDAAAEKTDRGCTASIGSCLSLVGIFVGLEMPLCSSDAAIGEIVLAVMCMSGFVGSLQGFRARPPSQDEVEDAIVALGGELDGSEYLQSLNAHRDGLHRLLGTAKPEVAVGILRILAVTGDDRSLSMAKWMGGLPQDMYLSRAYHHPDVKREAVRTATILQERLDLARQSGTLLRPSGAQNEQELLRPVDDPRKTAPELLLRADNPEDDDA